MLRLFSLGLLIFVIAYIIKRKFSQKNSDTINQKAPQSIEKMVKCQQCGVHLPISEAMLVGDQFYCCEAHLPHAP